VGAVSHGTLTLATNTSAFKVVAEANVQGPREPSGLPARSTDVTCTAVEGNRSLNNLDEAEADSSRARDSGWQVNNETHDEQECANFGYCPSAGVESVNKAEDSAAKGEDNMDEDSEGL
jgi:hypothetical protein